MCRPTGISHALGSKDIPFVGGVPTELNFFHPDLSLCADTSAVSNTKSTGEVDWRTVQATSNNLGTCLRSLHPKRHGGITEPLALESGCHLPLC